MISDLIKIVYNENKINTITGILFGIVLAPVSTVLMQIGIQQLIDYIFGENNYPMVWIMLVLFILNLVSLYSDKLIYRKIENRIELGIKTNISKLLTKKMKRDNNLSRGEIIQSTEIISDVVAFNKEKIMFLPLILSLIFIVVYFILNLNGLHLLKYILYVVPIILILILMTNLIGKYQKKVLDEIRKANDISTEIIEGFDVVVNYNAIAYFKDTFSKNNNYVRRFKNKINLTENLIYITTILISVSLIISMPLAASILYKNGDITAGGIFIASSLIQQIIEIIRRVINFFTSYAKNKKYMELLNYIENSIVDSKESKRVEIKNFNKLHIKDLSFSYDNKSMVLDNLSYEFEKNSIYIINGASGIGKTTLIKLIMNELDIQSGEIMLDDINVNAEIVKELISYSAQEPLLFQGSIEENIVFGMSQDFNESKKNEIISDIENVFRFDSIFKKANSLKNVIINSQSDNISSGQKKIISFARAIIKKAEIVILDEPSANLNIKQIAILKNELIKLKEGRIIIIVTHDSKLNEISNKALSIINGVIVNE